MKNKLHGIFPALITPFDEEGKVNEKSLQELVRMNITKGVNGFYVGGSTAEAFLLTLEERKIILEIVAAECKGQYPIISHIGCISTDQAIELAKHAEKVGVDAISSIPPFYYKFSWEEIKSYYTDILNNVDLPMIVYNFPAASGVDLSSGAARVLFEDERIIGVKHTSMDLYQLDRLKHISQRLVVFNGHDEVFLAGISMGADGAIGSTYNCMADKFVKIYTLYKEGRMQEARALQTAANDVIEVLLQVGLFAGIKYILSLQGIDCGQSRRPFKPLTEAEKERIRNIYNKLYGIQ